MMRDYRFYWKNGRLGLGLNKRFWLIPKSGFGNPKRASQKSDDANNLHCTMKDLKVSKRVIASILMYVLFTKSASTAFFFHFSSIPTALFYTSVVEGR